MLNAARHVHAVTGTKHLCLAGGVALNCVGNGRILREGPFEQIWIQPAAGDAGGALGAALFTWHQLLDNPRKSQAIDAQRGSLLGPSFTEAQTRAFLEEAGAVYHHFTDESELLDRVASLIGSENVVGWMNGRMEFGPRALGARSIIGDARSQQMQSVMNLKIKFRESFRPFAPCILREKVDEYFHMRPNEDSPYMLLVAPLQQSKRCADSNGNGQVMGLDKLKVNRSEVPAITHVDFSARVQTVDPERHGRYYRLIHRFYEQTGCPVIINTSFNVRGEPIVCTPADAWNCFIHTHMDALVIDDFVLLREEQPASIRVDTDAYLTQFKLD